MQKDITEYYEQYWRRRLLRFEKVGKDINPAAAKRLQYVMKLLPEKGNLGNVLDAGCGDGTTLFLLKNYYKFESYGVDISKVACQRARLRGIKAQASDITEKIPFPDQFFDLIFCSDVLEHLVFPGKALYEIYRSLKKEGVVIFSIPNITYLENRIHFLLGKSIFSNPRFQVHEHLRFWTKTSFEEFLKENKLKAEEIIGMQGSTNLNKLFKMEAIFSRYLFVKAVKVRV